MISTHTLTIIRTLSLGLGGLISGGYALAAFMGANPATLPHWLPLTAGGIAAVVIFLTSFLAGARNAAASMDESYQSDQRAAGNLGFWAAIVTGTGLWLTGSGGDLRLAITLTFAAAVYLLAQVVLELRGR